MSTEGAQKLVEVAKRQRDCAGLLAEAARTAPKPQDVSGWLITLHFYVLCLLAKAVAKSRGIDFRSQEDIRQWINTEKDIWGISKDYRKAEEMSREARYEGRLFNAEDIRRFNGWYCSVRRHLVGLIKSAGVWVPSLKPLGPEQYEPT